MRVLIVSPYRTVAPHFENELELAQLHLDEGDHVEFLSCLGELPNCEFNPGADPQACRECRLRRAHGVRLLDKRVRQSDFSRPVSKQVDAIPAHLPQECFVSVERLTKTTAGEFDVGSATLSSLISQVRDPDIDLNQYRYDLKKFSDGALQVYRVVLDRLKRDRPDRVYVFNGRFAAMRAVLRACQQEGVQCMLHERGCDTQHYQIFTDRLPHVPEVYQARMREHWIQAVGVRNRNAVGRDWFHSRVLRVEKNWHSFVKQQSKGRLPSGWDPGRHNIVVFSSSEDECEAIGSGWSDRIYQDQAEGVQALAKRLLSIRPDALVTVRIHPNQIGIDNERSRRLASLDLPNLRMIPPEAEIDSYQLMRVADTVATFGSTIGIESVFWSKPSVLLAPSFYHELAGPIRARDHEHAIDLLSRDLMPATKHEALVYGYWQNTHGFPFRYFEPDEGLFTGTFKGQVVYPQEPKSLGGIVRKQWRSIRKRLLPAPERRAA